MNIFQQAVKDIFACEDFIEKVTINGEIFPCVISKVEDTISYTDAGLEEAAPFTVLLKLPLPRIPKILDHVSFYGENFKVSSVEFDSARTTVTLHLSTDPKNV